MIIETLVFSLLIGKLRGGKIKNLGKLHIRGGHLLIIGLLLEIFSLIIVKKSQGKVSQFIIEYFRIIRGITFLLVIIALIFNIKQKWLGLTLIGIIMNFIPIWANNGKMPVSIYGLVNSHMYEQLDLLKKDIILTHTIGDKNTKFYYLSDIIPIPKPYPLPKVISFGDILISISLFLLIQHFMKSNYKRGKGIKLIDNRYFKL